MAGSNPGEMRPEYDLEAMGQPVVAKHYEKYRRYLRTIQLDERLAERFPDESSIVAALNEVADQEKAAGS
ncbi:hypothetical protein [Botrimarina sp.]|uniref:hypothetical protein n=1 Tax=Botrimarina sp. TaxID=2795802 RepID=UPI0032EEE47E